MMSPIYTISMILLSYLLTSDQSHAKNVKVRQTQEVNFSEMNLNGTVRNPDGAYLVQKKGFKFFPIHNVQVDLDRKIREASLYVD